MYLTHTCARDGVRVDVFVSILGGGGGHVRFMLMI